MKHLVHKLFIAITLFSIISCEKIEIKPVAPKADIYIAGSVRANNGKTIAVYWKNGVLTKLVSDSTTSSTSVKILVSGNDVYVTGVLGNVIGGAQQPVYWKNGVITQLQGVIGSLGESSIAVNGNDVYTTAYGFIIVPTNASSVPAYWKNGVPQTVQVSAGERLVSVSSVAVNGNDVYVCGAVTGLNLFRNAAYWKNGVEYKLENSNTVESGSREIITKENDVYIAGYIGNNGAYWKNGVATKLTTPDRSTLYSIGVKGTDVYLAGYRSEVDTAGVVKKTFATYWKNGVVKQIGNPLSGNTSVASAYAINQNGDDIYINGDFNVTSPSYFKNNALVPFTTNTTARGLDMFVVSK